MPDPAVVPRTPATEDLTNLFGLDRVGMRALFESRGEVAWRADQVMGWIYGRGEREFAAMTNLSKPLRDGLARTCTVAPPPVRSEQCSSDGTRKWLLQVDEQNAVETVFIPEDDRGTLCVSSQAGCAMDCTFCATGAQGFARNLTTAEIVAQVWFAMHALSDGARTDSTAMAPRPVSNVVFMGMGEPLANYGQLLPALRILLDDHGFGLSKRRVTVSTSGLVPFMDRLRTDVDTALAVSLHAPNDALRDELVPINRKYPLAELMDACRRFTDGKDRKAHIVYEYVMLDGVNDRPEHARQLARLLSELPAKVNLIPFNPFPGTRYRRSPTERIRGFNSRLRDLGVFTTTRKTRGDDIAAACGQLAGHVQDRQSRKLGAVPVRVEA